MGSTGLAIGAVAGLLLGGLPVLVLPAAGYVTAKHVSRARHSIEMANERGEVQRVKLWKTGKHAPLTEEGYWLVASDPRDSEMELFVQRVLLKMGRVAVDAHALRAFTSRHSGRFGLTSLATLQAELLEASWVRQA